MTVSRVTIHHQGAGVPSDATGYGAEGYTYGIGRTRWFRFRSVAQSFATKGFNGQSVDICLSGNRDLAAVTDFDLTLLSEVCADARTRGDLGGTYTTYPHGIGHVGAVTNGAVWTLPAGYPLGNRPTECPGVKTIDRWPQVVAATRLAVVPPTGDDDVTQQEFIAAMEAQGYGSAVRDTSTKLNEVIELLKQLVAKP